MNLNLVINHNNSKLFNPSMIFVNTKYATLALQKELARRAAVLYPGEHERIYKYESYIIKTLI